MARKHNRKSKKQHLEKKGKQTKWAPFWVVLKKFGKPVPGGASAVTHVKRNWRYRKLKIKPRKVKKPHLG
jgi:ribosomal protein L39E